MADRCLKWRYKITEGLKGNKNHFKGGKIKKICPVCKKEIEVYPYLKNKNVFCSRECFGKSMIGKMPSNIEELKRMPKSPKAYSFPKGEKHPNWIKNRNKIKVGDRFLNDPLQKQWSREVRSRDNWRCRINNEDCNGKVSAHHILCWRDFPELRYNVNNGITLCHAHHPKKRAEEKRLIPFFQGLVPVSNELKSQ